MDARSALGHLTRRTAGLVLHPRQTAREVAGDVKGVVGTGVGMGVGMAGHVVGGAVQRAGSLLDRGRDTTSDRIVDLVSDPRPVATSPGAGEPDKLHGDPVAPEAHEATRGTSRRDPTASGGPAKTAPVKKAPARKAATKSAATPQGAAKKSPAKKVATKEAPATEPATEPAEIRTPSGIPAAGPGHNPSTGETTDLTQPDTEPIVAASTSKAIRKEAEMMRRAASTGGKEDRDDRDA